MNNEPVAWMQTWENQDGELKHTVNIEQIGKQDIPLYTHPVKELTDEEWLITYQTWALTSNDPLALKKAILKKASEK